jgi:hypothetical protein
MARTRTMALAGRGSRTIRTMATLGTAALATVALGALVLAAPASAGLNKEFSVFDDCPVNAPGVVGCVVSFTTSGEFHLGSKTVPINKTITLQGGLTKTSNQLVPAADGNTLSKTSLQLPGGLVGIELLPGLTEVTTTAELAGPVTLNVPAVFSQEGVAVTLPLKAKLDNPSLGASCYVGSNAEPIEPHLTTGTTSPPGPNTPITGSKGTLEFAGNNNIVIVNGASLVDNAFAVPGASGCGPLPLLIDPGVDLVAGLPAAAGKNTAVLNTTFENVNSRLVIAQRELPLFGRCVKTQGVKEGKSKVFKGHFSDSGCTSPQEGGTYDWSAGPGLDPSFTGSAGKTTVESVGGAGKVSCKHTALAGQYTGLKTLSTTMTLTGCTFAANKAACQSSGAAAGEVVTSALEGSLGFVTDAVESGQLVAIGGLDLHAPTILAADCGGVKVTVTGSVIAPFAQNDKTVATNTLTFAQSAGKQNPEAFEEEAKDTLSTTLDSGSPTQSGLASKVKLKSAEAIEVKVEAN